MHRKHKKKWKDSFRTWWGELSRACRLNSFEPLFRLYAVCTIFAFATEDHSKTSPFQQPTLEIWAQRKMC